MLSLSAAAQTDAIETDTTANYTPRDDFSLSAFPVVFYLPETSASFGALGAVVFNIGEEKKWRKSQAQLGVAYTLKNQLLVFAPYELYPHDRWKLSGELGYYRYFYNFYGIGIDSREEDLEFYDANFPRLIVNASYRFTDKLFAGLIYRFDYFDIPSRTPLLSELDPVGARGGVFSSLGPTVQFDSRDDIFYPSEGWFVQAFLENSGPQTLADFRYTLLRFDARTYLTVRPRQILALNLVSGTTFGESPFFSYYYLASGFQARGIADRRFIDRNILLGQAEYRFPIYKRFSAVAFGALGTVAGRYAELFSNRYEWALGAGLRFQLSKKQKNNIRLDIGRSREGFNFYVTIGEAF